MEHMTDIGLVVVLLVIDRRLSVVCGNMLQGMDFVLAESKKYNIRLIMTLVNNWGDYGGKTQYVSWANAYEGKSLTSDDDFYTDENIRGWYKNYIRVGVHTTAIFRLCNSTLQSIHFFLTQFFNNVVVTRR